MARIRSVKPDFFTSETIARLPMFDRLAFIGLWTHVDDNGVCIDNPALVRAALFPLDEHVTSGDIDETLMRLSRESLVVRYVVDGKRYLAVRSWTEHQKVQHPGKARYPTPDQAQETFTPPSGDSHESLTPEQGAGSREQGGEQGQPPPHEPAPSTVLALVEPVAVAAAPAKKRNLLFDTLCHACASDPDDMTDRELRAAGVALAQIRKAWKGTDEDLADEIRDRAMRYLVIFQHATLTPNALANQWSKCTDQGLRAANPQARRQFARAVNGNSIGNDIDRMRSIAERSR